MKTKDDFWWKRALVYQIYPKSFCDTTGSGTGDLKGVIAKLDYIASLGMTDIWLCPFFSSPQKDNGYDVSDYYDVDSAYGCLDDAHTLITEARARGLGIIVDMVLNHTSDQHAWFQESRVGKQSLKRDWYIWRPGKRTVLSSEVLALYSAQPEQLLKQLKTVDFVSVEGYAESVPLALEAFEQTLSTDFVDKTCIASLHSRLLELQKGEPPSNWVSYFNGPTWTYDEGSGEWYFHLFSKHQPDLNWTKPEVREALFEVMTYWAEKGVSGFRLDAINLIAKDMGFPDDADPRVGSTLGSQFHVGQPLSHVYLQEAYERVFKPWKLLTIGECAGMSLEETLRYVGFDRKELSTAFFFDHMNLDRAPDGFNHKFHSREWTTLEFKQVWSKWCHAIEGVAWIAQFLGCHDQPRPLSRFIKPEFETVGAKMLAGLLMSSPGTPVIYQGEEIGMRNVAFDRITDYRDIETVNFYHDPLFQALSPEKRLTLLHEKSRDNARTPMQWSSDRNAGFTQGEPWIGVNPNYAEINVASQVGDERSLLSFYQKMTAFRRCQPVLIEGAFQELMIEHPYLYCFLRSTEQAQRLVLMNFSPEVQKIGPDDELYRYLGETSELIDNGTALSFNPAQPEQEPFYRIPPYHFSVH